MNWTRVFWLFIFFMALHLLLHALGISNALIRVIVVFVLAVPIGYTVEFRTRNS